MGAGLLCCPLRTTYTLVALGWIYPTCQLCNINVIILKTVLNIRVICSLTNIAKSSLSLLTKYPYNLREILYSVQRIGDEIPCTQYAQ